MIASPVSWCKAVPSNFQWTIKSEVWHQHRILLKKSPFFATPVLQSLLCQYNCWCKHIHEPSCCPTTYETSTTKKQKSRYRVGSFFNSSPLSYHRISFVLRLFWLTFLAPIQWSESPGQHAFSYLCSPVATTTAHAV